MKSIVVPEKDNCKVLRVDFSLSRETLAQRVMLEKYPDSIPEFDRFLRRIEGQLLPVAIYRASVFSPDGEERFFLENKVFSCRVINKLVEPGTTVFPFIATCGPQLEGMDLGSYDFMASFWLDCAKELALERAMETMKEHLAETFSTEFLNILSPGAADPQIWDIRDQQPLFQLFGDTENLIGVRLTEDCLMIPNKSLSGIAFPGNKMMSDCRFCSRKDCPQRKEECDLPYLH